MKIKMRTLQAGPDVVREVGHIYDVPQAEAKVLIDGGYAVEVKRDMPVERAVRVPSGRRGRIADPETTEPAADSNE
jgi:hypothetical protein